MSKAVIALGSNINPKSNIFQALQALSHQFTILGESKFVQTKPIGYKDQDDFINGAVLIETDLNREHLDHELKILEKNLGRVKSEHKFGPRSIDMDVVIYNEEILTDEVYDRDYLKTSVLELLPDFKEKLSSLRKQGSNDTNN